MSCFNQNTVEYKALTEEYGAPFVVDTHITDWQSVNRSTIIPSVSQVQDFLNRRKEFLSIKKREFSETVMANLGRVKINNDGIAHQYNDQWYINNSDPKTGENSIILLNRNKRRVMDYLRLWNIPEYAITYDRRATQEPGSTDITYSENISIDFEMLMPQDFITENKAKNKTHINLILDHLKKVFPQVQIKKIKPGEASRIYELIPGTKKVPFEQVNSFFYGGTAYIIEGRVSTETAVEEVLHPFVSAIKDAKPELYDKLVSESKKNFPQLYMEITDAYTDKRGFNESIRAEELVTQALSRHFSKEFEQSPTQGWKSVISEIKKWLSEFIKDIYQYVSGNTLKLSPGMLNDKTTLTDIAKLLNTGDLQFLMDPKVVKSQIVKFSLEKQKADYVNKQIGEAETKIQKTVTEDLTKKSLESKKKLNVIAGAPFVGSGGIVVLDESTHTYTDANGNILPSTTTMIKGYMSQQITVGKKDTIESIASKYNTTVEELIKINPGEASDITNLINQEGNKMKKINVPKKDYEFNIELGNDFDALLEGAVLFEPWNEVKKKMKFDRITEQQAETWYNKFSGYMMSERDDGSIFLPQVVIYDKATGIAGTIDLLKINRDGSMQVIDLKSSINSVNDEMYSGPGFPITYGSQFYDDTLVDRNGDPDVKGQMKMNTRMQHSLQVNVYSRILQNMGYRVHSSTNSENTPQTWHVNVETKLENGQQVYVDSTFEGKKTHGMGENMTKVNDLVPLNVDPAAFEKYESILKEDGVINPAAYDDFLTAEEEIAEDEIIAQETYTAIFDNLTGFQEALFKRKEAIEQMRDSSRLLKSKKEIIQHIDFSISAISIAMRERKADILYTELVQNAIDDLAEFEEYIKDEKNFGTSTYINKVQNFSKLAETFRGLTQLKDYKGLDKEQSDLILELEAKARTILGERKPNGTVVSEGLVDQAVDNYIRTYVTDNTIRKDLTKEDLDTIMTWGNDIGLLNYSTSDLATQGDTLLALMDKLYKQKQQEAYDKIDERNRVIRQIAVRLQRLSKSKEVDFNFMLIFDKEGNFTGRYVKEIGQQYYDQIGDIRSGLFDKEGEWIEYIYHADTKQYTAEEQEFNKKLFEKRKKLREFMQAEEVINGKPEDGRYHRFTQEFKDARNKYQIFRAYPNGKGGKWLKKKNIGTSEYQQFLLKYYDSIDFQQMDYDDKGNITGRVRPSTMYVTKRKFKEIRKTSRGGSENDMLSEKYLKLQDPQTELEVAQKDFYDAYIKYYENDLLKKLPPGVMDNMLGRVPMVKGTFIEQLKQGPAITTTLFAKMTRGWKNFWQTTSEARKVVVDEHGDIIETLPVYYVGNPRDEKKLKEINDEINELNNWWKSLPEKEQGPKNQKVYNDKKDDLISMRQRLQTKPAVNEISTDMADSLLRFSAMAEQYEVLGSVEETLQAFMKVINKRQYKPVGSGDGLIAKVKGKVERVGRRVGGLEDPNIVRRVRKWMKMTYYQSDQITKNWFDKLTDGIIQYTSLTYVGFNPWGNFNNYMVGRLSNAIEYAGENYLDRSAAFRAEMEFNKRAIPDIIKRIGHKSAIGDLLGLSESEYAEYIPRSKYEAMVNYFRMMDKHADIRESGVAGGKEDTVRRIMSWGYLIQDAAEYNVQTKLGVGITMSWQIKNSLTGETKSVYDAMKFDSKTGELTMEKGYDTLVHFTTGKEVEWNDKARYNLRNYIREANKQTHGNYAQEDRMVMQQHSLGKLAAQFHKWLAPMVKARFRQEYFDENLGWVEGRYRTLMSFISYGYKNMNEFGNITKNWKELQGEKGQYKINNMKRNMGDVGVVLFSIFMKMMLTGIAEAGDDEDESVMGKRLMNALIYQMDRQRREFLMFWFPFGIPDAVQLMKSPLASARAMEEILGAIYTSFNTLAVGVTKDGDAFKEDKRVVYQRGSRKGQLKMKKQWLDAIPLLYSIEKWRKYETMRDFWVK